MTDSINLKKILKQRNIALITLMILACSLLTGDTTLILPSLLFIGIFTGIMNSLSMKEALVTNLIGFVIGSLISIVVSLISVYYLEGGLYAIAVLQYGWFYIIMYTFIGVIGSALGYYFKEEIKDRR